MGRLVSAGALVYDQLDFYLPAGSINRPSGVVVGNLSLTVFADNAVMTWPLADGSAVADSSISAGTVYFNEIAGAPGYYSVRFFPDRVAQWRLVFVNAGLSAEVRRDYTALPPGVLRPGTGGLNASFSKSC